MNRKLYGNQYIEKTWKDIQARSLGNLDRNKKNGQESRQSHARSSDARACIRNPHPYLDTHRLWIASAYADLMTEDKVEYRREIVEAPEEPAVIMERIAKRESGGKHFDWQGRLMKHVNKDGSVDYGKFMINDKRHEHKAARLPTLIPP